MNKKEMEPDRFILRGIILPSQWDKTGKVVRISLNTDDEKEYMIACSGRGRELRNYTRKMIEVDGKVIQQISGDLSIKVDRFNVVENNEA
jgi:hypothetical protein